LARPLSLSSHRALSDFLSLDLSNEGTDVQDESTNRRILELLSHEVQLDPETLCFVKDHADVVLISGYPIDRVGENDINRTPPDHVTNFA